MANRTGARIVLGPIQGRPGYLRATPNRIGKDGRRVPARWEVCLNLNSRSNRWRQMECKRKDKDAMWAAGMAVRDQIPVTPWEHASILYEVYVRVAAKRDYDNLSSLTKAVQDALTPRIDRNLRGEITHKGLGIIADDNEACIGRPEVRVLVDPERAYSYQVTVTEVLA